ncbi:MAG: biotin--protein ligase [Thermoactinomyces sp.]
MVQMDFGKIREIVDVSSNVLTGEALLPFAFDETVCREVGNGILAPLMHIWRHRQAVILGLRDRKLPHAPEAIKWLRSLGYRVAVRNSGGAAVPLDSGVVNISLVLPSARGKTEIKRDFEIMYELIRTSLNPVFPKIDKGEIVGSYCPGDFDLSIQGKKFCGIAQRRQTRAFVIQAFVLVEGSGRVRGDQIRQFYNLASNGDRNLKFPHVEPLQMAALAEWDQSVTTDWFISRVKEVIRKSGPVRETCYYNPVYAESVEKMVKDLKNRYSR